MTPANAEDLPSAIGHYRVLSKLGEGGMGTVYLASQEEPIRRTVAVKVIRAGLEGGAISARFESERQALALMDHPTIARALDAGTTDAGQPYFVMEYVDGVPITDYCDQHRLSNRERLELLARVCDGLHHAHQKATIHRDIKPSNVLVAEVDGGAVPKIIDFGVAKATEETGQERTFLTELGQLIGTPDYMSPEQAALSDGGVDIRTDVYSTGVLLYVLLAGALPFDPGELRRSGVQEVLRRIRDDEPPRPSARLTTVAEGDEVARVRCKTSLQRLASELKGDLDWITMKALEKDRSRRYASMAAMAEDIRRYLRHEPVSAGPPSAAYRATKFMRRHRGGVAFAALAAVFLGVLVGSTLVQNREIGRERDRANAELRSARQLSDFVVGLFRNADPGRDKGADITARELLMAGAKQVAGLDAQPEVQANFRETIGSIYGVLGLFDEGRELLEEAHDFRKRADDGSRSKRVALASSQLELGRLQVMGGAPEKGRPLLEEATDVIETQEGEGPLLAEALNGLGNALWNMGELSEAEVHHRRALEIRRRTFGEVHEAVAGSLHNVGSLRFIDGDLDAAEEFYGESIRVAEATVGPDDYGLATTLHTLAMVKSDRGELLEARQLEERSLGIREATLGPDHPHVALSLTTLAEILVGLGEPGEAEPLGRRAVAIGTASWGPDYSDTWWMERGLAATLNALGRHNEAAAIMEPLLVRVESAPRPAEVPLHLAELGFALVGCGRLDEAEGVFGRLATEYREDTESVGVSHLGRARILQAQGSSDAAIEEYAEALHQLDTLDQPSHRRRIECVRLYAALLRKEGNGTAADELEATIPTKER